jgi:hypothetical protein
MPLAFPSRRIIQSLNEKCCFFEKIVQKYKSYIYVLFTPSTIPEIVSKCLIFQFAYICKQYLLHMHSPNKKKRKEEERK